MKNATLVALLAYLEALKDEGYKTVHMGSVIPMQPPQPAFTRRAEGLERWTQFPDIEGNLPEGMFYDRLSGMIFFDEVIYNKFKATA